MNKREQQRKIKEQKRQAAIQKQQSQKLMIRIGLFVIAPVFLAFVLFTIFSQGPTYSPVEIAENDHLRGSTDMPVSIVVYADFQCPACATETENIARAWPSLRNKAHVVFRHYPITNTHPHSWTASLYAEAASKQGRFWEMHDALFANQAIWAALPNPDDEFDSYALELNLDLDQLKADMRSDEVITKLRNDQRGGNQAGVRATPTLFINGDLANSPNLNRLIELVDRAYEQAQAEA